jgi:hypothetical protein
MNRWCAHAGFADGGTHLLGGHGRLRSVQPSHGLVGTQQCFEQM